MESISFTIQVNVPIQDCLRLGLFATVIINED